MYEKIIGGGGGLHAQNSLRLRHWPNSSMQLKNLTVSHQHASQTNKLLLYSMKLRVATTLNDQKKKKKQEILENGWVLDGLRIKSIFYNSGEYIGKNNN